MKKAISFMFIIFLTSTVLYAAEYKKESSATAFKPQLSLEELELINLILIGESPSADIEGSEGLSDTAIFSGNNHDIDGEVITGGNTAIGCNIGQGSLNISDVTLEGVNGTVTENVSYTLNMNILAPFLRKNADTTITEASTLQNTTVGSAADYQILYVNDVNITLARDFIGYGILYIEDSNHNQEEYILEMTDNAKWHGVILIYQLESNKLSKISLNGAGGGGGTGIGAFSMLGITYLGLGNNAEFDSGNVGVSDSGGNLVMHNNNDFEGSLFGDTITAQNNNEVDGDITYNTFTYGVHFDIGGDQITPLSFPFITLPAFPSFSPGTQNISRNNNVTYTLAPGSYNNITFKNNCTLILSGGDYYINQLTMDNNCTIKYSAASTIHITKKINMGSNPKIIPYDSSVSADDCIFYIEGDYSSNTNVFQMGVNAIIKCNVYAPNIYSSIDIGTNAECRGSIIGNRITIDNNIDAVLESAFSGEGEGEAEEVSICGSIILIGNQFHIPAEGSYTNNYYCEEAIESANSALDSAVNSLWMEWKESE
ncbi:MAG: hypothetical protein P9X27_00770 [Candidatus Kaelpia aquatica]|nr:hypothetical protein [Candidatus Kaelpia aquatica]